MQISASVPYMYFGALVSWLVVLLSKVQLFSWYSLLLDFFQVLQRLRFSLLSAFYVLL
jgi:hypothetical protein